MNLPMIDINYSGKVDMHDISIDSIARMAIDAAIAGTKVETQDDAELSLMICDDSTIQELNSKWRNKNKPTNVLSFPGEEDGALLGDIVVSMDTVRREAGLENKPVENHLIHLIVHGFLHLFGYDHETEDEALKMESLETLILGELGIADPYENA